MRIPSESEYKVLNAVMGGIYSRTAGAAPMSMSNPLLWPKVRVIWGYGIALLSVYTALLISRWPPVRLETAPVSLFLGAIMLSAWFGGLGPGLLATALSSLAFDYYFLPPIYSLVAKPDEIPRLVIFTVSALFVGSLSAAQRAATESLRRARDDLRVTVQELQKTNEALHAESLERKHAEEALRNAQGDLARVSRMTTLGELTASLAHEVNQPIAAAVTNANTCLRWLTREHPDLEEAREAASRIVKDATRAAEIVGRTRLLFKKGTAQRELVIKSQETENEEVIVSVSDTGAGLPAQQADQIFKAFFTTKPQGTGMGLSISRSIVEAHGGRLWADGNSPRGASFNFTLSTKNEGHG